MIKLTGFDLNYDKFKRIVIHGEKIRIDKEAMERVNRSYKIVNDIIDKGKKVYGITTGFGKLVEIDIPIEKIKQLQKNIIRSHSVGVGNALEKSEVRGAILLRINTILRGNSGVSPNTLKTYIDMLNKDLYPFVPQKGSVGASGDLAPLSHIALAAMGEGEFIVNGKRVKAKNILKKHSIKPLNLKPKEGLALINGTQIMTSIGAISLIQANNLIRTADIIAACSMEGLLASTTPFLEEIQNIRNNKFQKIVSKNISKLLKKSAIRSSHICCKRVQDAYSLRCIPQVHGAIREAYNYVSNIIEREMNASTDNPLIIGSGDVVSAGNFHGETIAIPLDTLKIAISELANISDRRIYRLLDKRETQLYEFLVKNAGLNSGFMMLQVTSAALVSENKVLSHPASVDSIPTSLGQEDHVSMGTIAARQLKEIVNNSAYVLAIELFASLTAIKLREPKKTSHYLEILKSKFFKYIKPLTNDRPLYNEIEYIKDMIIDGKIIEFIDNYIKIQ